MNVDMDMSRAPSLDLSKATKLKDVVFDNIRSEIQWVTTTIKTIKSKDLQQIGIISYAYIPMSSPVRREILQKWQDLDHLLVQLWTSHSVRPKIMYQGKHGADDARGVTQRLLPELTRRGIIDVAMYDQ